MIDREEEAADLFALGLLEEDLPRALVGDDLALHPLQRVVDRLRVAAENLRHRVVRLALQVEAQRVGLEPRQAAAQTEDEALELLGRDHADGRIIHARAGKGVAERAVPLALLPRG